jgi:excisionase family DNA binding protein
MGKQKKEENYATLQPLLSIADACKVLNLSRPKIYDLIGEGLPIIRFGRAVRISPTSLQRWLAQREQIA